MNRTMSNGPHLQEFEHLQDVYRHTCEAFERGELTSANARNIIVSLRHTDASGVVWKVDTTRSGRRAAFARVDGQGEIAESVHSKPSDFAAMDREYRNICAAFERGEISASTARSEVLALQFVDEAGRTWKIDTQRSGKRAAFIEDESVQELRPVTEAVRDETEQNSADSTEFVDFGDDNRQLRLKEVLVAAVSAVAAISLVVGLATVLGSEGGKKAEGANSSTPTFVTPLPTIPTNTAVTYPLLSTFNNRGAVPTNTNIEFGRSVLNRPLTFIRRGNPNGVRVLVVGCIHGNECAGIAVVDLLKTMALPPNIDLWILPMLNPDGFALKTRQNANKVDLNRNFPVDWRPLGKVGYWQWAGTAAATEPEVKSMISLGNMVQPQLSIWYHQDYFRISPGSGRDGEIRKRYANLVNLPVLKIEGGSYSGTASMWSETMNKGTTTSLTVEFGKGLRSGEAEANASAITRVIDEFFPT